MKTILLAAAAFVAMPALAQTQPTTPPTTTPPADTMSDTTTAPGTPADTANPPGTTSQAPMPAPATSTPMADAPATSATPMTPANPSGDPVGGYAPAAPALSGPVTPGVAPIFRPSATPSEAFPAPAPLASYPVCKKGEFDNCRNGPNSTHSREVRGRAPR